MSKRKLGGIILVSIFPKCNSGFAGYTPVRGPLTGSQVRGVQS